MKGGMYMKLNKIVGLGLAIALGLNLVILMI